MTPARSRAALLTGLAYLLLAAAWAFGNPPFAAPDEWAHQLRAIGVGEGELIGRPGRWPIPRGASELQIMQTKWVNQALRTVTVPPGSSPVGFDCNATHADQSAACENTIAVPTVEEVQLTPVGTYQPAPYLLPGLALRVVRSPEPGNHLARVASGLPCLVLLALAAFVVAPPRRRQTALAGLLVAVTPMAVFLVASLNGSGLEIASGITFAAALARLGRPKEPRSPGLALAVAGASGATLAVSRSTGPLWIVLLLLTFLALDGLEPLRRTFRERRKATVAASSAVVAGVAASGWWQLSLGPHVPISLRPWPETLREAIHLLPTVIHQEIGNFGSLDSPLPGPAYLAWLAAVVALVALALFAGTGRQRIVLVAAFATLGVVLPVLLHAAVLVHTGFAIQGRDVLPVTAALPILAAEILVRRSGRLPAGGLRTLLPAAALLAGSVQVVGWYWNARRQATGVQGPLWFIPHAEWSPPLGWWPWLGLALAGAAALVAAGVEAARAGRGAPARAGTRIASG